MVLPVAAPLQSTLGGSATKVGERIGSASKALQPVAFSRSEPVGGSGVPDAALAHPSPSPLICRPPTDSLRSERMCEEVFNRAVG